MLICVVLYGQDRYAGFKSAILASEGVQKGSHATDYRFFGVMVTYGNVNVGISPANYRGLVASDIEKHRHELDEYGIVDDHPYWDWLIKELMVNNLATYYLARLIVSSLRNCTGLPC